MPLPAGATVVDVGLRDGLQNETVFVSTEEKLRLAAALVAAGVREMEVTSFVRPDLVPQMADAEALVAGLPAARATYVGLIANVRGYERALAARLRETVFVLAATDAFNERNVRRPVRRSLEELRDLCRRAARDGANVRAAIAVAFGCPYSGAVDAGRVVEVARRCADAGARYVEAADTIGIANPRQVRETFARLRHAVPAAVLGAHFHDTRGLGLANVWAAADVGIDRFDASIAGLGGCPFAPGAAGNLATEDLVYLLDGMRIRHGVDLDGVLAASRFIAEVVGHPLTSKVYQAGGRLETQAPLVPSSALQPPSWARGAPDRVD
jgi:hydroxymethylglutaryl-CoA lyase